MGIGMEIVQALLDECLLLGEEFRKCCKRYGRDDKRTVEAYYRYLSMEKARDIALEKVEDNDAITGNN